MISYNFLLRSISALFLVTLFVVSIVFAPVLYYLLIATIGVLIYQEWRAMTKNTAYFAYGWIIASFPTICLALVKYCSVDYKITLLYFLSLWSTDTFAMIGGKTLQGPKLAPKISPNKTWSGLMCGCLASATVCFLSGLLLNITLPINLFIYGIINAIVAQISDLFISFFKRKCFVKDTGTLIPGHGGALDRFDGTMFSAALLLLLLKL